MRTGKLNILIDKVVPCLIDNRTNEEVPTIVVRINQKSHLKGYNHRTGWYVNWQQLFIDNEIYALYVAGDDRIQGLCAVQHDKEASTVLLNWAVSAPHNNPQRVKRKEFDGVGAHLFAIAIDRSYAYGYDGIIIGHPSDRKIMDHYIQTFHAQEFPISMGYQYTIVIWEQEAAYIRERYTYEYRES